MNSLPASFDLIHYLGGESSSTQILNPEWGHPATLVSLNIDIKCMAIGIKICVQIYILLKIIKKTKEKESLYESNKC